jgi:hypothetical protein
MNWVERRIKKEEALRAGSTALWQDLGTAIREAVETYNDHYGKQHGNVQITPSGKQIALQRDQTTRSGLTTVRWQVSLDVNAATVFTQNEKTRTTITLKIQVGDDGHLFFSSGDNTVDNTLDNALDADGASKALIEGFLFNPKLYLEPR